MYEFTTGKLIQNINFQTQQERQNKHPNCQIYSSQFQKGSGELIVAGGAVANEARIFEVSSFNPVATVSGLSRAVYTIDWNNAGDMIAMAGGDGVVRCFNVIGDFD